MTATWLADALRAGGCRVDESLVPNWKSVGHTDGPFTPVGVLGHHTAGPAAGDLPSFNTVRVGRPGLDGPLAQLMLTRGGVFVPIAAGRAWHAGAADRPANFPWVPRGDGNGYLIGIEAESTGLRDDWTPEQRAAYPLGVAALLRHMGVGADRFLGHKEWAPSRKPDPAFWDLNQFRATVQGHLGGIPAPAPAPAPAGIPACPGLPAWPYARGTKHRFGLITDPSNLVHGGINQAERNWVLGIQRRLIAKGYVPGVGDWRNGWADGRYEQATADAVARFQHREMPGTTYFGQVWSDDWAKLSR